MNWNEYKEQVKAIDPIAKEDLDEIYGVTEEPCFERPEKTDDKNNPGRVHPPGLFFAYYFITGALSRMPKPQ